MSKVDSKDLHPAVPFLYEMVISFFNAARRTLDPVLQDIDGFRQLETLEDGRPVPADHIASKFANLPQETQIRHIGACLSATTNLGLAYVHSFRLLCCLTQGKDAMPASATRPILTKLYDALPSSVREGLSNIFDQVGSHDFEMELSAGPFPPDEASTDDEPGGKGFRSQLTYWQNRRLLHESHLSLSPAGSVGVVRLFIPLRSVLILDQILANQVAPRLGHDYQTMNDQLSNRTENPQLKWDGETIYVSLPDKLGDYLEARWNPTITSIIRIRESGTVAWSPGFETPFNMCSFVDLKPDTEYEVQVTHKNQAGESQPSVSTIRTDPVAE